MGNQTKTSRQKTLSVIGESHGAALSVNTRHAFRFYLFLILKAVDFVFSSDVKYVAAISEDGCLRVIDALAEQFVSPIYINFRPD